MAAQRESYKVIYERNTRQYKKRNINRIVRGIKIHKITVKVHDMNAETQI